MKRLINSWSTSLRTRRRVSLDPLEVRFICLNEVCDMRKATAQGTDGKSSQNLSPYLPKVPSLRYLFDTVLSTIHSTLHSTLPSISTSCGDAALDTKNCKNGNYYSIRHVSSWMVIDGINNLSFQLLIDRMCRPHAALYARYQISGQRGIDAPAAW